MSRNGFTLVDENFDGDPDYVIFDVYGHVKRHRDRSYNLEIPHIETDAVRIFYSGENVKIDMTRCEWAIGSSLEEDINNPRYERRKPYPSLSMDDFFVDPNTDWLKVAKEKTKFCSFVARNEVNFRENFCRRLSERKNVDCLGVRLNNGDMMPRGSGTWQDLNTLSKYKFSLGFENTEGRGYTTEKLLEPMQVNTIPIYWGNPAVARDFNTESFICAYDFDCLEDVIDYIIELDQDDEAYADKLSKSWLNNDCEWVSNAFKAYRIQSEIFA
jgi:hypothetical protein